VNTIQFSIDKDCLEACDLIPGRERPVEVKWFELQMFPVDIGNGKDTWCGSLQRLHDGEKHYFKGWSGLVANLQVFLTPIAQLEVLKALLH
jgi:hypothetical protein